MDELKTWWTKQTPRLSKSTLGYDLMQLADYEK